MKSAIGETGTLPVPLHIRNAPTRLMRDLGYAKGYKYAHDYEEAVVPQDHLPEKLQGQIYYSPTDRGYEKVVHERLTKWRRIREQAARDRDQKEGREE